MDQNPSKVDQNGSEPAQTEANMVLSPLNVQQSALLIWTRPGGFQEAVCARGCSYRPWRHYAGAESACVLVKGRRSACVFRINWIKIIRLLRVFQWSNQITSRQGGHQVRSWVWRARRGVETDPHQVQQDLQTLDDSKNNLRRQIRTTTFSGFYLFVRLRRNQNKPDARFSSVTRRPLPGTTTAP